MSIRVQSVSELYDTVLLSRTREIQAGDRRRLARDIHDLIGNSVGLALRHLDLYEIHREGGRQPAADDKLEDCRRVLGDVLDVCRRLISDLRLQPPVASLSQALSTFVQSVDHETVVDVSVLGDEAALPSEYRDELFLVMREGLRNVFAHAHAQKATALVQVEDDQVFAVVSDDGVGFDTGAVGLSGRGDGISTMKERTELLGGRLSMSSHPPHGTRIEIRIPLPEPGHAHWV
jgi:signal transduction histidine kinase